MLDKSYSMKRAEEEKLGNRLSSERPNIGICFDWRLDPVSHHYVYIPSVMKDYRSAIDSAGGELYVLSFEDDIEEHKDFLDGYIIPGGRDIHPKFYGAEVKGSIVSELADVHFDFNKQVYRQLPLACPLLGICWGFQFLNVVNGGTMIQHMPDTDQHYAKRRFKVDPGSWIHKSTGGRIKGNCYHHQALDKLGENVHVVALDDHSKTAHAIEVRESGRDITGILWHPEISFANESREQREESAEQILSAFVEKCAKYKRSKRNFSSK